MFRRTRSSLETVKRNLNQSDRNRWAVLPATDSCGNGLGFIGKSWSYWQNQASASIKSPNSAVSEHTVRALRDREAVSVAERKQRLMSIFGNVAELGAERMEELAGKSSLRDAGITAGIATDKLLALTGQTPPAVGVVIMPSETDREERHAIDAKLDAIARRLAGNAGPAVPLSLFAGS